MNGAMTGGGITQTQKRSIQLGPWGGHTMSTGAEVGTGSRTSLAWPTVASKPQATPTTTWASASRGRLSLSLRHWGLSMITDPE